MPHFTTLNLDTGFAYAMALAALFGLSVANGTPVIVTDANGFTYFEYTLSDDSIACLWLEDGHVYGEA